MLQILQQLQTFRNRRRRSKAQQAGYQNFLAWDPDFTKLTSMERTELEEAEREIKNGETVSHDAINWDWENAGKEYRISPIGAIFESTIPPEDVEELRQYIQKCFPEPDQEDNE